MRPVSITLSMTCKNFYLIYLENKGGYKGPHNIRQLLSYNNGNKERIKIFYYEAKYFYLIFFLIKFWD